MDNPGDLSGTVGAVLDPVLALRTTLTIPAGEAVSVIFTTFHANDRDDATRLAEEFSKIEIASRPFDALPTAVSSPVSTPVFQDLAGLLLFGARSDCDAPIGSAIKGDRRDLITLGVTGELPVLLASVGSSNSSGRITELVAMHRYWSLKGIDCDFVIVTDDPQNGGSLKKDVESLVLPSGDADTLKQSGGIFVFDLNELNEKQTWALNAAARIEIDCDLNTLAEAANG